MQTPISPETALREQMVENAFLRNRVLILSQQVADRDRRITEIEARLAPSQIEDAAAL